MTDVKIIVSSSIANVTVYESDYIEDQVMHEHPDAAERRTVQNLLSGAVDKVRQAYRIETKDLEPLELGMAISYLLDRAYNPQTGPAKFGEMVIAHMAHPEDKVAPAPRPIKDSPQA